MEISEQDKWLYFYTLPCTDGNTLVFEHLKKTGEFNKYLKGDFSREKVREYFLIKHNEATLEKINKVEGNKIISNKTMGLHLLIPYCVRSFLGDSLACSLYQPFYDLPNISKSAIFKKPLDKAIELEVIQELPKEGDVLLVHGGYIVDVVEEKDLKKYRNFFEEGKKKKR